jgi:hypothetical protein
MPLLKGSDPSVISENIRTERNAGKPEDQAIAIAMHTAHKDKPKKGKKPMAHPAAAASHLGPMKKL